MGEGDGVPEQEVKLSISQFYQELCLKSGRDMSRAEAVGQRWLDRCAKRQGLTLGPVKLMEARNFDPLESKIVHVGQRRPHPRVRYLFWAFAAKLPTGLHGVVLAHFVADFKKHVDRVMAAKYDGKTRIHLEKE